MTDMRATERLAAARAEVERRTGRVATDREISSEFMRRITTQLRDPQIADALANGPARITEAATAALAAHDAFLAALEQSSTTEVDDLTEAEVQEGLKALDTIRRVRDLLASFVPAEDANDD